MNTIFFLSSCNTCSRILSELKNPDNFILQDLDREPLTENQLDELRNLSGNYEKLFNKRTKLYRQEELHTQTLSEKDYKNYILRNNSFLKCPLVVVDSQIIFGNATKIIKEMRKKM